MPKLLTRIVAFLLLACLIADPSFAALWIASDRPRSITNFNVPWTSQALQIPTYESRLPNRSADAPIKEMAATEMRRVHVKGLGRSVSSNSSVFEPVDRSTQVFLEFITSEPGRWKGKRVLELGTATGVLAIALARAGATVVATDINAHAVDLARLNIAEEAEDVRGRIKVSRGNLFEALSETDIKEGFDAVLFNHPIVDGDPEVPEQQDVYAGQYFSVLTRTVEGLRPILRPGGHGYLWAFDRPRTIFLQWGIVLTIPLLERMITKSSFTMKEVFHQSAYVIAEIGLDTPMKQESPPAAPPPASAKEAGPSAQAARAPQAPAVGSGGTQSQQAQSESGAGKAGAEVEVLRPSELGGRYIKTIFWDWGGTLGYWPIGMADGAAEFLKLSQELGIKNVLVTSAPRNEVDHWMQTHGIAGFFAEIICPSDKTNPIDKATEIRDYLGRHSHELSSSETVGMGDDPVKDLVAFKQAGITSIGVLIPGSKFIREQLIDTDTAALINGFTRPEPILELLGHSQADRNLSPKPDISPAAPVIDNVPRPASSSRVLPAKIEKWIDSSSNDADLTLRKISIRDRLRYVSQSEFEGRLERLVQALNHRLASVPSYGVVFDFQPHRSKHWVYSLAQSHLQRPPALEIFGDDQILEKVKKWPPLLVIFDDMAITGMDMLAMIQSIKDRNRSSKIIVAVPFLTRRSEKKLRSIQGVELLYDEQGTPVYDLVPILGINGLAYFDHKIPDWISLPVDFSKTFFSNKFLRPYRDERTAYFAREEAEFERQAAETEIDPQQHVANNHRTEGTPAAPSDQVRPKSLGTWALLWKWCFRLGSMWGPVLVFTLGPILEGGLTGLAAQASRGSWFSLIFSAVGVIGAQLLMHALLGVFYWNRQRGTWNILTYKNRDSAPLGPWFDAFMDANMKAYTSVLAFLAAKAGEPLWFTLLVGIVPHLLTHIPSIFWTIGPTLTKQFSRLPGLSRTNPRSSYFTLGLLCVLGGVMLALFQSVFGGISLAIFGAMVIGAADWAANKEHSDLLMITNPRNSRLRQWARKDKPGGLGTAIVGTFIVCITAGISFAMAAWDFGPSTDININLTLAAIGIAISIGVLLTLSGIAIKTAHYLFNQNHQNMIAVIMHDRRLDESKSIRRILSDMRSGRLGGNQLVDLAVAREESERLATLRDLNERIMALEQRITHADQFGEMGVIDPALRAVEEMFVALGKDKTFPAVTLDASTREAVRTHSAISTRYGLRLLTVFPDLDVDARVPYQAAQEAIRSRFQTKPPQTTKERFQSVHEILEAHAPLAAARLDYVERIAQMHGLDGARGYLEVVRPFSPNEMELLLMAFPPAAPAATPNRGPGADKLGGAA